VVDGAGCYGMTALCEVTKGITMRRTSEVLLIEDCDQRRRDYKVILDFLNETSYITKSQSWLDVAKNQIEEPEAIVAVLLGDCNDRDAADIIQEVHDWDPGIPFVYIGSAPLDSQIKPEQRCLILSMLEEPITYNQLLDHLHRAQNLSRAVCSSS
jgi:sigma-54 specific flagellar transcriptional regulator A